MKFHLTQLLFIFGLTGIMFSCKTKDILPNAELSASANNMSEGGVSLTLTANLNGVPSRDVTIQLSFAGTGTIVEDYTVSNTQIIIPAGTSSGSITISGILDGITEGTETIEITITSLDGVMVLNDDPILLNILDGDIDSDGDGVQDSDDLCPNLFGDAANNGCPFVGFIINEVLYDPADGEIGDANGDGVRDPLNDEFIEFFNSTATPLDISGYTISDASQTRHTFPSGTVVPPNGAIVVFGGGTPTGTFGGAIVQTASGGQLNFTNSGDFITIRNASNAVILTFDINLLSGNPNEAYTRNADVFGDFARHSAVPEAQGRIHSPGTKLNGLPF